MFHEKHENNVNFKSPIVGFILSGILVFAAYYIAMKVQLEEWALIFIVIGIAVIQTTIQLMTFLNMRREKKPRWGQMLSFYTAVVIVIVFVGSLWIMRNLRYNMAPSMSLIEKSN